jgi:uncharacterized PurR-regulated membrane protein YhhQ (DUF165 family)
MNPASLILWTGGLGVVTLIGSLSARKYSRGTLLIAMLCVLAASAQLLPAAPVRMLASHDLVAPPGIIPLALSFIALCAVVEKFGQVEGHRAALFATVGQAFALLILGGARQFPPSTLGGEAAAFVSGEPLQLTPWLALASLTGYLMGSNLCVVLYHMLRVLKGERHVWLRALCAPIIGGSVESFVSLSLGFGGREDIAPFVLGRISAYAGVTLLGIPLLYLHRTLQGRRVNP